MKVVDILIPNYNRQNSICECVKTALNQKNISPIVHVIDNNSSDDSVKLLRSNFNDQLNKNLFIHEFTTTVPMIDNWNRCLKFIQNEYFKYLFSDDYLDPNFCYESINIFNKYPKVSMVTTNFVYLFGDKEHSKVRKYGYGMRSGFTQIFLSAILRNMIAAPSNCLIRTKSYNNLEFIQNPIAADMIFFADIIAKNKIFFLQKDLAYFEKGGDSVTNNLKLKKEWIVQNYEAKNILLNYSNSFFKSFFRIFIYVYCIMVLVVIKYENKDKSEFITAQAYIKSKINNNFVYFLLYSPLMLVLSNRKLRQYLINL